jgi:hypothetical protein
MKRSHVIALGVVAAFGAVALACDLNPQPLPPIIDDEGRSKDNGDSTGGGGGFEQAPAADPSPSTGPNGDAGAFSDGDAGDGGTTDAGPDAG